MLYFVTLLTFSPFNRPHTYVSSSTTRHFRKCLLLVFVSFMKTVFCLFHLLNSCVSYKILKYCNTLASLLAFAYTNFCIIFFIAFYNIAFSLEFSICLLSFRFASQFSYTIHLISHHLIFDPVISAPLLRLLQKLIYLSYWHRICRSHFSAEALLLFPLKLFVTLREVLVVLGETLSKGTDEDSLWATLLYLKLFQFELI